MLLWEPCSRACCPVEPLIYSVRYVLNYQALIEFSHYRVARWSISRAIANRLATRVIWHPSKPFHETHFTTGVKTARRPSDKAFDEGSLEGFGYHAHQRIVSRYHHRSVCPEASNWNRNAQAVWHHELAGVRPQLFANRCV
jgi:hypothetical protein